jgi:ABC-2 type transport system permease protein
MTQKIKGLFAVLKRETAIIIKDVDIITIILLSPLFYSFFYSSIYTNKSETDVPVVVVDMDHSTLSKSLIRNLDAHQLVKVNEVVSDYSEAIDRVYKFEDHGIIYIPKDFESNLKKGIGTELKVYLNTTRFLISNDINKAVTEVTSTIAAGVKLKYFQAQGFSIEQAREIIEPLKGEVKPLFNPTESYGDFLIPGLLVLVLQQTLLMGLAESIAKERENKTLHNLWETSNKSIWAAITGKSLYYFLIYAAYAILFFVVHFSIFKINFKGDVLAASVLTVLFLASVIYISIFISSFFNRKIISLQVFAFTTYPVFLVSGYPWPFQAMPKVLYYFAMILPSTPYLNAFNRITQMGAGWNDVVPEVFHLLILCIIGLAATRIRMKTLISKETNSKIDSIAFRFVK